MFRRILKIRGVRQVDLMNYLSISKPTAQKYIDNPENMDGNTRLLLAKWHKLNLPIDVIDDICNGVLQEGDIQIMINKNEIKNA